MSLQYLCDVPEQRYAKYPYSESPNSGLTRSNTPEYEKGNNYDDRDSTMDSLRSTRLLSASSSMSSVDMNDPNAFEIEYLYYLLIRPY